MKPSGFQTCFLPDLADARALDGSEIRRLCRSERGSLVHVSLAPGQVSRAVAHRAVEEFWYFLSGRGEIWRSLMGQEEVVEVAAGAAVSLPAGTVFQFRALGSERLTAVCVTMPPWPGDEEAESRVGPWSADEGPR